jgi:selenocysteine lyase/cysteine desulfurase
MEANHNEPIYYSITGKAAHERIAPLLPIDWIDVSPYANRNVHTNANTPALEATQNAHEYQKIKDIPKIHFIWENAPRNETKEYRNKATVYSHLPNGISILDDKWNMARLLKPPVHASTESSPNNNSPIDLDSYFRALETHCFRGLNGYYSFYERVLTSNSCKTNDKQMKEGPQWLYDLHPNYKPIMKSIPSNTWVIKDAQANGNGGIWFDILHESSFSSLSNRSVTPTIPFQDHRYVAQKYVWPMVLYQHRKCHVRVYVMLTNDSAFVHRRCFLHVANETFGFDDGTCADERQCEHGRDLNPSVHITNCCANSHDRAKFAGEICANLSRDGIGRLDEGTTEEIGLKPFFPSISASIRELARKSKMFVQGGDMNNAFEYLGLDFILSYEQNDHQKHVEQLTPVAYLLEINCPPSQDTATGLKHAEDLHNEVLSDWMKAHVVPIVNGCCSSSDSNFRGWIRVYEDDSVTHNRNKIESILPSKAAILNKIMWELFERKSQREYDNQFDKETNICSYRQPSLNDISAFARSQFPYFGKKHNCSHQPETSYESSAFLENAGGSQVPNQVILAMQNSLSCRHRTTIGAKVKVECRKVLSTLLGADEQNSAIYLGLNATSLFDSLARLFEESKILSVGQDIILATENHLANITPWLKVAKKVGMKVHWWTSLSFDSDVLSRHKIDMNTEICNNLSDLLTPNTKLVCISHASNILGSVRNLSATCKLIRLKSPQALIVCDGVAAVPHVFPNFSQLDLDFYIISCHKVFGPHLGVMCASKQTIEAITCVTSEPCGNDDPFKILEQGTINFEACAGVIGTGQYFTKLSNFEKGVCEGIRTRVISTIGDDPVESSFLDTEVEGNVSCSQVKLCYERISMIENSITECILEFLGNCSKVRIIKGNECMHSLPIISFIHNVIPAADIVLYCESKNIFIRSGNFLSSSIFQNEFQFSSVVRASFCHYNTLEEARRFVEALKSMKGWE